MIAKEGQLTAYVTTFNNVDKVGDVVAPGALDDFIKDFNKEPSATIPMLWQHNLDEMIGQWDKFEADSQGVKGFGEIFTDVSRGNDVRNLIKRGAVGSVSIGFQSTDYVQKDDGILFKEIQLKEVSVVVNPANPRATITSAKTEHGRVDLRHLERGLRELGLSKSETLALISGGKSKLREAVDVAFKNDLMLTQLSHLLEDI